MAPVQLQHGSVEVQATAVRNHAPLRHAGKQQVHEQALARAHAAVQVDACRAASKPPRSTTAGGEDSAANDATDATAHARQHALRLGRMQRP